MTCVDFELIVTWSSVIQPVKRPEMEEVDNNGRQFGLLNYELFVERAKRIKMERN